MRRGGEKTQMVHARIDSKLKKAAERVLAELGMSMTEAIRLFLEQVVLHRGLPFAVSIPNRETVAAMLESNDAAALERYRSFHELADGTVCPTKPTI